MVKKSRPAIEFTIPLPPSANNLYVNAGKRGRVKSKAYTNWITAARVKLMLDEVRLDEPFRRYALALCVPAHMRGDISNRIKAAEDLCKRHGLIEDDKDGMFISIGRVEDVERGMMKVQLFSQP